MKSQLHVKTAEIPARLKMYFDREIAKNFAEREQNEKNFRVSEIMDSVIMSETEKMKNPLYAAELGGGAHPDRYHSFFAKLLSEPKGRIDWVDASPFMLELAEKYLEDGKYQNRKEAIKFIKSDINEYLEKLPDKTLDLAIMKYTINYLADMDRLFGLLAVKLKPSGRLISTIGALSPEMKSISTNARYLYREKEFPKNETRRLEDGESFIVKFFKESNNPSLGYLEGAETTEYYHSPEKMRRLAGKYDFQIFLGDWKDLISPEKQTGKKIDQNILVLRKR
jgi:ubiquinone/menaquinone biosynthesis C-methylase UbiE